MLTPQSLERSSQAFRRGYYDGAANRPVALNVGAPGTFAAVDYADGYRAGANDVRPRRSFRAANGRVVTVNYETCSGVAGDPAHEGGHCVCRY